jgi:hypothetical protein
VRPGQFDYGVTRAVCVADTFACAIAGAPGFCWYEIQIAPEQDPSAPCVALITRDIRIYEHAAAADGSPQRFDVTWHRVETKFGIKYEIDRFERR